MEKLEKRPWFRWWPEGVPRSLEYPEIPLSQILRDTAARVPRKTATIFFNNPLTYEELDRQSDRMAVVLRNLGAEPGDRVALWLPNCPQFVISHFGALKAGAISVPFNPTYTPREAQQQLEDCGARVMIGLDMVFDPVHEVRNETPLEHVVLTSIVDYLPTLYGMFAASRGIEPRHYPDTLRFQKVLSKAKGEPPTVEVDPQDVAVLLYTGGTTGVPKGVMLTHSNLVANALQTGAISYMEKDGVVLAVLPFFHSYGMTVCLHTPLSLGATVILLPRFGKDEVLEAIERHRPTHFPGVPTIYVALLGHPDLRKYSLKSVRYCVSGAAPLPVEVARKWKEVTGAMIVEGYGLTETSPVTHANPLDDWSKVRFGSIGIPVADTDARIVDLEKGTEELPPGEVGELVLRGPQVMKGYWNKPEETDQVLRDGWFSTGDIAKMDEDGYFHIVDRKKDMVIVGGYNVYPRDVEEVLYEHEAVEMAAVIGIPDAFHGEAVKAFVVLKPERRGQVAKEDLVAWCEERLTKYKVPKVVEFRDALPTTLVGKVLRRELREDEGVA